MTDRTTDPVVIQCDRIQRNRADGMVDAFAEVFQISLPVRGHPPVRPHLARTLVPTRTLTTFDGPVIRRLSLSADESALILEVHTAHAPRATYTVGLEELADFIALVHAAGGGQGAEPASRRAG